MTKCIPAAKKFMTCCEDDTLLEKTRFVPDTSEVLQDMDEEWKEGALSHQSEKLAN